MLNEDIEQEIVSRAQQTPESFGLLYDHYFPKIYNYIYHRNNTQLAEDLVSRLFTKHWPIFKSSNGGTILCLLVVYHCTQSSGRHVSKNKPVLLDESWAEGIPPGD